MTRTLIEAGFEDRDRIAGGWEPSGHVWGDAPMLNRWAYGVHPTSGTMALVGFLNGQARTCASVVAMLTGPGGIGSARTLTGWLRLVLTSGELHREGRHLLPAHARELELAAFDAGYCGSPGITPTSGAAIPRPEAGSRTSPWAGWSSRPRPSRTRCSSTVRWPAIRAPAACAYTPIPRACSTARSPRCTIPSWEFSPGTCCRGSIGWAGR